MTVPVDDQQRGVIGEDGPCDGEDLVGQGTCGFTRRAR